MLNAALFHQCSVKNSLRTKNWDLYLQDTGKKKQKKNGSLYKLQHPQAAEDSNTGISNLLQKTTSPSISCQDVTWACWGLCSLLLVVPILLNISSFLHWSPTHMRNQICLGEGGGGGGGGGILRQAVQILYNIYIYIYYTGTETGLNIWWDSKILAKTYKGHSTPKMLHSIHKNEEKTKK